MTHQFIRRNNLAFFCYDWLESIEMSMNNEITTANLLDKRHTVAITDPKVRKLKYNLTQQLKQLKNARIALKQTVTELRYMTRTIDDETQINFGESSDDLFSILELVYEKSDRNPKVIELVRNFVNSVK